MLNKHNLAVAAFCSTEQNSFRLSNILIAPEYTAATDGIKLARIAAVPELKAESFPVPGNGEATATDIFPHLLLPAGDAKMLAGAIPAKNTIPVLACAAVTQSPDGFALAVSDGTNSTVVKCAEANETGNRFPDIDRVISDPRNAAFACSFAVEQLYEVCALLKKVTDAGTNKPVREVTVYFETPKRAGSDSIAYRPAMFKAETEDGQDVTVALMGCSTDVCNGFWKARLPQKSQ
jgi:hypothetical protein